MHSFSCRRRAPPIVCDRTTTGRPLPPPFAPFLSRPLNPCAGIFHSNFGRLSVEFQYAKGHSLAEYGWQDKNVCDQQSHRHPDRDGYFDHK